ncbi:hypothetical protein NTE_02999 [Candidatus Nitrososphaera evergladensis SR1]|uniref:Uncharacterized protein n=1 Tax=Candidatus Nitrososphaera evergladensis SR1 TaxID=1459636 RepID=A0A075N0N2_9ARCH|nr:hypothetical protein [Candidatus Nitrososphaera evergladensis]AIF85034.1 hypothetical protein NTE_02999 [Candidatus Nitrososphaera evergladensis SR1]
MHPAPSLSPPPRIIRIVGILTILAVALNLLLGIQNATTIGIWYNPALPFVVPTLYLDLAFIVPAVVIGIKTFKGKDTWKANMIFQIVFLAAHLNNLVAPYVAHVVQSIASQSYDFIVFDYSLYAIIASFVVLRLLLRRDVRSYYLGIAKTH